MGTKGDSRGCGLMDSVWGSDTMRSKSCPNGGQKREARAAAGDARAGGADHAEPVRRPLRRLAVLRAGFAGAPVRPPCCSLCSCPGACWAAEERHWGRVTDRALRQTEPGNNFLSIVCRAGFLLAALIYKFFSFNVLII